MVNGFSVNLNGLVTLENGTYPNYASIYFISSLCSSLRVTKLNYTVMIYWYNEYYNDSKTY